MLAGLHSIKHIVWTSDKLLNTCLVTMWTRFASEIPIPFSLSLSRSRVRSFAGHLSLALTHSSTRARLSSIRSEQHKQIYKWILSLFHIYFVIMKLIVNLQLSFLSCSILFRAGVQASDFELTMLSSFFFFEYFALNQFQTSFILLHHAITHSLPSQYLHCTRSQSQSHSHSQCVTQWCHVLCSLRRFSHARHRPNTEMNALMPERQRRQFVAHRRSVMFNQNEHCHDNFWKSAIYKSYQSRIHCAFEQNPYKNINYYWKVVWNCFGENSNNFIGGRMETARFSVFTS